MRIKILSDGVSTRVVNAATGEEIEGVVGVAWDHAAPGEPATASFDVRGVALEAEADVTAPGPERAQVSRDLAQMVTLVHPPALSPEQAAELREAVREHQATSGWHVGPVGAFVFDTGEQCAAKWDGRQWNKVTDVAAELLADAAVRPDVEVEADRA